MDIGGLQQEASPELANAVDIGEIVADSVPMRPLAGNQLQADQVELLMCRIRNEEGGGMLTTQTSIGTPESILAALVQGSRRRTRGRRILFGAYYVFVAALAVAYLCSSARGDVDAAIDVVLVSATGYALLSLVLHVRAVLSPMRWSRPSSQKTKLDDVRNVGHLADALAVRNVQVARQAEIELTGLLPQIREADGGLLSAEQRQCIYREMLVRNVSSKPEFIIAALGLVERIGDTTALPEVLALASRAADTAGGREVKASAESCLQVLRQTESQRDARRSLLRASNSDAGSSDTLLRPAEQAHADNPDELLRAHVHEQTPEYS